MEQAPGYLARIEATHVGVRAGPDVVFLRLTRHVHGEGQPTCMFVELSPGETLTHIADLQAAVNVALATKAGEPRQMDMWQRDLPQPPILDAPGTNAA